MSDPDQTPARTVVCATDLSDASRCALDVAIEIACGGTPAQLHVLYVKEVAERIESAQQVMERWEERQRELHDQIEQETEHVRALRGGVPELQISTVVRHGKVYREIVRYALEVQAETLVVGTHGRTGLGRVVIGSVAERVVHHAPCDVVVAKSAEVRAHMAELIRSYPPR